METNPGNRAAVIISSLDAERLYTLLERAEYRQLPGVAMLEKELERAEIREPADMPPNVVTMNSQVEFCVQASGQKFSKALVYPKDMDDRGDKVSVLAPVGSALLGLSEGAEITWPGPDGALLHVRIQAVAYQPERAGELHR